MGRGGERGCAKININFGMEIFDKFTRPLFVINVVINERQYDYYDAECVK